MKLPRRRPTSVEGITLHTAKGWRRNHGRLLVFAVVVLAFLLGFPRTSLTWAIVQTFMITALASVAGLNALLYRRWDRRITAMEVVVAMHAAKELCTSGIYTEEEADAAFTEHMRSIG